MVSLLPNYCLEKQVRKIHAVKYTGNQEVDAILFGKLPLIQAKQIAFRVEGILPVTLPFDFFDICVLLSNALDNTIEACVRQGGERRSHFVLSANFQHGFLKLELSNPISNAHTARQ